MKNSANYEVAKFDNQEEGLSGWYILQVNSDDRHVIWQSEVFATEEEAKTEMATTCPTLNSMPVQTK